MTVIINASGFILLLLTSALLVVPGAGWSAIKLFMKDGTYQLVESYKVRGDRVRYYSVERSDWEEVPKSLVDFEATERAQKDQEAVARKELEGARETDKERFDRAAQLGFEIAPGIRLPQEEGVFAFDGARVIRMVQSSAEVVTDKKRAALLLALPGPLLKNRSLVVLPGPRAAIRILALQPAFYVQLADASGANMELIPINRGKQVRVVERVQSGIGAGQSGELRAKVPLERKALAPGLFKLTPTQPLNLGEYALGELLQQKLNLELWDFGIDGAAQSTPGIGDRPPVIRRSNNPAQN